MFITFEGLDGSGGTTQLARLAAALRARGREVVCTREPSDGPVGRLIRQQLAGGEVGDAVFPALFAADRRDHLDRVVLPARARGAWVLSDRYFLSSLAYQSASVGFEVVWALNQAFPAPDLCVVLDLPLEDCLARVEARAGVRDRFETEERLRIVEATYAAAIQRCVARGDRIARVDARGSVDEVHARVWDLAWPG